MKTVTRVIIFSAAGLYITSQFIKGMIISHEFTAYVSAIAVMAFFFYLAAPISKIIFFPLNIISLGLFSVLVNIVFFHIVASSFDFISIKPWVFEGANFLGLSIPRTQLSYWQTISASAISYSTIINLLDRTV